MVSSLHFCFVKVHRARASGAPGFPPDIEGDKPWHVLSDRMLKVKETAQDDPSAELMVSFLWNSARLASVQYPSAIELELRFQVLKLQGWVRGGRRKGGSWLQSRVLAIENQRSIEVDSR